MTNRNLSTNLIGQMEAAGYPADALERLADTLDTLGGDDWLVLAAGDFAQGSFNAMTVGWGFFGTLLGKSLY